MSTVAVTYGNLRIAPYELVSFQNLTISKELNDHARLTMTGIVPEDKKESYVEMTEADTTIEVSQVDEQGNSIPLFHGIVLNVGVKAVRGVYHLEVEAVSHTYLLDVKKKNRSFQNHGMTYDELLDLVAADYEGFDVMDEATGGASIGNFTMQYQETDWEFLKRLASRFYTSLMPASTFSYPKFYFGVYDTPSKGKLDNYHYQVGKKVSDFLYHSANDGASLDENDFMFYEVETEKVLDLGNAVEFQGRLLYVRSTRSEMRNGLLVHRYVLCSRRGLRQRRLYNERIIGASIQGRVIGIQKDTVQVHLYMDKKQDKATAHCFPYASMYTAEGNSGWYCMPEVGDHVRVYFPGSKEEEGVASSSVRQNSEEGQSNKLGNPDMKYFRTAAGKELLMGPEEIVITGKDGEIFIRLNESGGIEISSSQMIKLIAKEDIMIDAGQNVAISAKEEISLTCKESNLLMNGSTKIIGTELNTN
ncbi:contractile injection system protein, VgrG/Pvc8 family [Paenibacillus jiagnxiensis]|uniref:contractile injection system protein, VgrG/Pvc8 family n=1 Tax=Paenibacillus jiagnxiensis TaxID=3228926 RepID=UPI0033BD267F